MRNNRWNRQKSNSDKEQPVGPRCHRGGECVVQPANRQQRQCRRPTRLGASCRFALHVAYCQPRTTNYRISTTLGAIILCCGDAVEYKPETSAVVDELK